MFLQAGTQWDALAHFNYGGMIYNGIPSTVVDNEGAHRCGIDKVHEKFVGRGVLLDVARANDLACLPSGYRISPDDLDRAERNCGAAVGEGDIVLIRTGLMATWKESGDWGAFRRPQPGLDFKCATWLHDKAVAAVAADNTAVEATRQLEGVVAPFHMLALRDMGLHLGEYWYLEELAADCAGDGVSEFLLVAPALPFEGAVGSPVNPIAIK
jgi:kynurenine formamidase